MTRAVDPAGSSTGQLAAEEDSMVSGRAIREIETHTDLPICRRVFAIAALLLADLLLPLVNRHLVGGDLVHLFRGH
jgi:hypothetical protein